MKLWMETILHLIFWVLCFWILYSALAFESLEVLVENGIERSIYTRNPAAVPTLAIVLAARALLFYGLSFGVLSRFPEHRQWRPLLAQLALLVAASYLVEWGLLRALNKPPAVPPGIDILLYLFFTLAAFAYRLAKDWWRNERLRARLAEEKLTAELNYLKAQLNPHFLFNTLNNLYALAERAGLRLDRRGDRRLAVGARRRSHDRPPPGARWHRHDPRRRPRRRQSHWYCR